MVHRNESVLLVLFKNIVSSLLQLLELGASRTPACSAYLSETSLFISLHDLAYITGKIMLQGGTDRQRNEHASRYPDHGTQDLEDCEEN